MSPGKQLVIMFVSRFELEGKELDAFTEYLLQENLVYKFLILDLKLDVMVHLVRVITDLAIRNYRNLHGVSKTSAQYSFPAMMDMCMEGTSTKNSLGRKCSVLVSFLAHAVKSVSQKAVKFLENLSKIKSRFGEDGMQDEGERTGAGATLFQPDFGETWITEKILPPLREIAQNLAMLNGGARLWWADDNKPQTEEHVVGREAAPASFAVALSELTTRNADPLGAIEEERQIVTAFHESFGGTGGTRLQFESPQPGELQLMKAGSELLPPHSKEAAATRVPEPDFCKGFWANIVSLKEKSNDLPKIFTRFEKDCVGHLEQLLFESDWTAAFGFVSEGLGDLRVVDDGGGGAEDGGEGSVAMARLWEVVLML